MSRHETATDHGPPRGRGHYNDDGSQWWDDTQQRWFRTTDDEDVLEIDVEDAGHTSMLRSIATTMTGQHGTQSYRFVGRARSGDPRWGAFTVTSGTFPVLPLQLPIDSIGPDDAYGDEMRARLDELDRTLVDQGWRPTGQGERWWSKIYTRSCLDWDTLYQTPDRPAPNEQERRAPP